MSSTRRHGVALAPLFVATILTAAHAAEGMWTFEHFPFDKLEQAYGFKADQALLDHIRLSSLRIKERCSASFVSPHGLVQTNRHCVISCIPRPRNSQDVGFYAKEAEHEQRCVLQLDQLLAITDVTARLKNARGTAAGFNAEWQTILKECRAGAAANIRCELVVLHGGGLYSLYRFRVFSDVRLVLAPERAIGSFGGEIDDFEFPRHSFDIAYLRVYDQDRPLDTNAHFLRYAKADAQVGDLTIVAGSPGWTDRSMTLAQLEFRRDIELPQDIIYHSELLGLVTGYAARGEEQALAVAPLLARINRELRNKKKRLAALADPTIIRARAQLEQTVRAIIAANPDLHAQYSASWDNIAASLDEFRVWRDRYQYTVGGLGFRSQYFKLAQAMVRHAAEKKPTPVPGLLPRTDEPLDPEFEKLTLTFSLTAMRDALGSSDPLVRKVLIRKSPRERAEQLIDGTILTDRKARARLIQGGAAAIDASTDPMIVLARNVEADWRALEKDYNKIVLGTRFSNIPLVAQANLAVRGNALDPVASFTPRVSFGTVEGYRLGRTQINPITTIGDLFEAASGARPYKLPERWLAARGALNLQQPLNFASTNDLIGGFSGSPAINRHGEIIGVMFDLNAQGLGGYYGYNPAVNRAVGLSVGAIREVLAKVYKADRLLEELSK